MTLQDGQMLPPRQETAPLGSPDELYVGDEAEFWHGSQQAYIIKWAVIAGIFLIVILSISIAYLHAKSRMKKGRKPLAYHWWLVPRKQKMQFDPVYQNQYMARPVDGPGREQDGYAMQGDAPPPPAYKQNYDDAPPYLQPSADSKVNPDQADYDAMPPAGPPPTIDDRAPAYPAPVAGSSLR